MTQKRNTAGPMTIATVFKKVLSSHWGNFILRRCTYWRVLALVLFATTIASGSLVWWYITDHAANLSEMVILYARASCDKDLLYHNWNAAHGGVYASGAGDSPSNHPPHIREPRGTTPLGRTLTLISPAQMAQQVHRLAADSSQFDTHIHFTSANPESLENVPDEWEREGLLAFARGEQEVSAIVQRDKGTIVRLMRPLYVDQYSLERYAPKGYKEGDLLGGISIEVPVGSVWAAEMEEARKVLVLLVTLSVVAIVAIVLIGNNMNRRRLERNRVMDALAKKQEFLNAILDIIRDGIVACNEEGALTVFNRATRQFHGLAESPLPADQWPATYSLYQADGVTRMKTEEVPLYRAFHGEVVRNAEMAIVPKGLPAHQLLADGQQLIVDGRLVGAVVVMHDITETKEADRVRRESEERYRTLVENVDLGIALLDCDHRVVTINAAEARMVGKTPEECIGKECFRIFENRDTVCPHCPGDRALKSRRPEEVEVCGLRNCGDGFVARVRAFPVFATDNEPTGFIEVIEDITDHKRAEEELCGAKQAAETASRAKSEFLANMSHEIRTPMTAILGFMDVLMDGPTEAETVELAQIIKRNGEHLLSLINDILDLSKIEAGKQTVRLIECQPSQLVADVVAMMKSRAVEKGLLLLLEYHGRIPEWIQTDPVRLRQILVNLIGNAIKFTMAGSVRVVVRREGSRLCIDVIDTGMGIAPDQMAALFQPFSQADSSTRRCFGGSGLGLVISKRLAEMLGGDVKASSVLGRGSTFSATIDCVEVEGSKLVQPAVASHMNLPDVGNAQKLNCRILLAEDGPDNQRLIAFLLRKAGANVTIVDNGRVAVDAAIERREAGTPFDLVLLDMQMPVMDGYQAARQLRKADFTIPIVALTAHAMAESRQECIDAGCDDYLSKPIDRKRLVDTLALWVGTNRNEIDPSYEVSYETARPRPEM